MQDEYFDILDEHGQPTGEKRLRSEAHAQGLWHRTVHIYLFRKRAGEFEFLVHLRAGDLDLHPNCWDTRFGGHVKAGETMEQTVIEEVKDEIGLDVSLDQLVAGKLYKRSKFPNNEFTAVYYLPFEDESLLKFNDGEVKTVRWMTAGAIMKSMDQRPETWASSHSGFQDVYETLQARL